MTTARPLAAACCIVWLVFGACAEGGSESRPGSEVKLSVSHHMFGFIGAVQLRFPVRPSQLFSDRGIFILRDDGTYAVRRPDRSEGVDDYALDKTGALSVLINRGPRRPRIRFAGAYGLDGNTSHYFFSDRFHTASAPNVGLFWGVKLAAGTPDLEGAWHVFSQHVIFTASRVLDPDNVGRSAGGTVTIDADGDIEGSGTESTKASLTFSGTARPFADGRVDLTLDFADKQGTDRRTFLCAAAKGLILGLDEKEDDGEAGLIALVRKRTGKAEADRLAGLYFLGAQTIFVDPTRGGVDAAIGSLELNDRSGFRIVGEGSDPDPAKRKFTYTGTFTAKDDGTLTLKVDGTNETWMGAFDQEYKTVVLIDNFVESRTGNKPAELNVFLAIRRKNPDR